MNNMRGIKHFFDKANKAIIRVDTRDHEFSVIINDRLGLISDEEYCHTKGYELTFDTRDFTNVNGKTNHLVLENDFVVTDRILKFVDVLRSHNFGKILNEEIITNLHPSHIDRLVSKNGDRLNNMNDPRFRNVVIDSLFQDRKQFFFIVTKLFDRFTECNFIVFCPNLLDVLNEEILKPQYQESEHWNSLIKVATNNTIYLCEETETKDYYMHKIRYNKFENNFYVFEKRRLLVDDYNLIDKSFKESKKDKWD